MTDTQPKQDIESRLLCDPEVNAPQIDVSVDRGAVSLHGALDAIEQKCTAKAATKRVRGARSAAQYLTVELLSECARSDAEIAGAILGVLEADVRVPATVNATVHHGSVTLQGQVTWDFERDAAERAIRNLEGVVNVHNSISVTPQVSPAQVRELVFAALERQTPDDAKSIQVGTSGSEVTLTGFASTWQSIVDAENAAWAAPGVAQVLDQVKFSP